MGKSILTFYAPFANMYISAFGKSTLPFFLWAGNIEHEFLMHYCFKHTHTKTNATTNIHRCISLHAFTDNTSIVHSAL